jgi:hypothetical protein
MQALGCLCEQVSVLVIGAALDRHSIPDGGDGLVSSPGAPSAVRNSGRRSPRLMRSVRTVRQASALSPAHAFDREQHLLGVRAHAENNEQRDRGRLTVKPHANDGAVEDQAHDRIPGRRVFGPYGAPLHPSRRRTGLGDPPGSVVAAGQCVRRAPVAQRQIREGVSAGYESVGEASASIARYFDFYDGRRPHQRP